MLKIAKMTREHNRIDPPVGKPEQRTESDLMHSGSPHAVVTVEAPVVMAFHTFRVIFGVCFPIVCFLKANHSVKSRIYQPSVIPLAHGLYLDVEVVEVFPAYLKDAFQIIRSAQGRIFTCHYKEIVEGSEALDCLAFPFYFIFSENLSRKFVVVIESAIHAFVGAGISDIHGDVEGYGFAESLRG